MFVSAVVYVCLDAVGHAFGHAGRHFGARAQIWACDQAFKCSGLFGHVSGRLVIQVCGCARVCGFDMFGLLVSSYI